MGLAETEREGNRIFLAYRGMKEQRAPLLTARNVAMGDSGRRLNRARAFAAKMLDV
jgi:hypothetical protein